MANESAAKKTKPKKAAGPRVFLTISNPQDGANVQNPSPGATTGGLCVANGQADAPDAGFMLERVTIYNVSGAAPASNADIDQYGRRLSFDANRNWSDTSGTLLAYLASAPPPQQTNTFSARYRYRKNGTMPPVYQIKSEDVTYTTQRVATCPAMLSADVKSKSDSRSIDIGPHKKSGKTYLYKAIPTNQGDMGIRLMVNRSTALRASEIQVAVVKADWTPQKGVELPLHRPVGAFESVKPVMPPPYDTFSFRFPSKHKHAIVLFQPSTQVIHTLSSQTTKVPDRFSLHNFVDIHVMVNDLDIPEFYADNDGTYDLWVRVTR